MLMFCGFGPEGGEALRNSEGEFLFVPGSGIFSLCRNHFLSLAICFVLLETGHVRETLTGQIYCTVHSVHSI